MQSLFGITFVIQIDQIQIRVRSNDLFVEQYLLIELRNIRLVLQNLILRVSVDCKKYANADDNEQAQ